MNQKLKRYDPNMHGFHKTDMCEDADGDYVTYSDYQKLQEQLGKAEEVISLYMDLYASQRARQYFKEKENP